MSRSDKGKKGACSGCVDFIIKDEGDDKKSCKHTDTCPGYSKTKRPVADN
ncbi:MAG: hypothetical protein KAV87_46385 [Desulfobacteraceae bacterium]|nr:hypothetical protein [Desulfobacteraceae bacterium]